MSMPKAAKVLTGSLLVLALGGGTWALSHHESGSSTQTTDDAYVQADFSTVAPRVAGTIAKVLVEDNQQVRTGDLLAVIDDRDFRVAVSSAQADLRAAEAKVERLRREIVRHGSAVEGAAAKIDSDRAVIALSQANARRYQDLASDGSASQQEQQEAASRLQSDLAGERRDSAAHAATRAELPVLQAELADAQAMVARSKADLEAARLRLTYTEIRAPVDGVVGQRSVRIGNYVQVGAPLLALVPVRNAYVEAHFRETQLAQIHPGQPATVTLDALPGITLKGHVQSIAPATGVSFGAIAPENATGNFTKITQRLSVRIAIDDRRAVQKMRVGMSAVPTIETSRHAI